MRAIFLLVLALFAAPACSPAPAKDPSATAATARETARLVYSSGVLAVSALEELRIVWMKAQANPTPEAVALAEKVSVGLHAAADALAKVKPWLVTGEGELEAKRQLREGLERAASVATLLNSAGADVPEAVLDGVDAALVLLGSEQ